MPDCLHNLILFPLCFALALIASPALASESGSVFRCASDGRIVYSDIACANGGALALPDNRGVGNLTPHRTDNSRAASQRSLQTTDRQAQRDAQTRERQRKADVRRQQALDKKKMKCAQLEQRKKWAEEDQQAATLKNIDSARRKVQRATELYLAQCRP